MHKDYSELLRYCLDAIVVATIFGVLVGFGLGIICMSPRVIDKFFEVAELNKIPQKP